MVYYNEQTNLLHVYKCLLTNRLHDKAAELCLADSLNNSVTTTKYIEYNYSIRHMSTACVTRYPLYHVVLVKFYCDVITRSHLQLINTSINTFFSKLRAFLAKQRRRRKAVKRKLDGTVDESSVDQKICKSDATVRNL